MNKLIKGDQVIVIAGKDKGKQGQVVRVLGDKIVVEGVNVAKRHQKPNPMRGVEGGIVLKNMPLAISNVAIFNPKLKSRPCRHQVGRGRRQGKTRSYL